MNFVTNHAPGTGSIARPIDQQSSSLPKSNKIFDTVDLTIFLTSLKDHIGVDGCVLRNGMIGVLGLDSAL